MLEKRLLLLLTCSLALSACNDNIPPHTANPPPLSTIPVNPPQSSFVMSVHADLTGLKAILAGPIQGEFNEHGSPYEKDYRWRLDRQSGPDFTVTQSRVYVTAGYRGDVETKKTFGGCHLNPIMPVLHLDGLISVVPSADDWTLGVSDPHFKIDLAPGSDTHCGFLNIEVHDKLEQLLNSDSIKNSVLAGINKAQIHFPVRDIVHVLDNAYSVELPDHSETVTIYPQIFEIGFSPFNGPPNDVRTTVRALANPVVLVGADVPVDGNPQIVLGPVSDTTPVYNVTAKVGIPFSAINDKLEAYVATKPNFTGHGYSIALTSLQASDANGRLLVSATVTGSLRGTFYLWGTPTLNTDASLIHFPGFQLAFESATILDKIKFGLAKLIFGNLGEKIKPLLTVDLAPKIQQLRSILNTTRTVHESYGDLSITDAVSVIKPLDIFARPEGIYADISFQGAAQANFSFHM